MNDQYVPAWAPDQEEILAVRIRDALDLIGADWRTRADDDLNRATEILPATDASVLGRVLAALGAPPGQKATQSDISLPAYLDSAPDDLRREFVKVYLWNRAAWPSESDVLQVMESRPQSYLEDLSALIEDVSDASVSVSENILRVSVQGTEELGLAR